MKPFALLFVFVAIISGGLMPGTACAQGAGTPTNVGSDEFSKWLVGTEWEYSEGMETCTAWFVTPDRVILGQNGSKRIGKYHARRGGWVEWTERGELDERSSITMQVLDMNAGHVGYHRGSRSGSGPSKLIKRYSPTTVSDMSLVEFENWLNDLVLTGNDGHAITVNKEGVMSFKSRQLDEASLIVPRVISPGVVQFSWKSDEELGLLIISPDLSTYEAYFSRGSTTGMVADSEPAPGVRAKNEIAIQDAAVIPLKKTMASLNSLMVMDLGNSRRAGKSSKLSISALKLATADVATLKFNQIVGKDMQKALEEVARFHSLRHSGWPRGYRIELAFADKYTSKDGPSAAVACALALESLLGGVELEPAFAVTGDLNADGAVQPIGGVSAKVRGAANSGMRLVAIPEKNRGSTVDLAITEGITPFLSAQVFSIATFDDALALARTDKAPALEQSLAQYALLCDQLRNNPAALRSPAVVDTLTAIAARTPNHVAARLLLAIAQNKLPGRLSAAGSLEAIDQTVASLVEAAGSDMAATSDMDAGQVAKASYKLMRLRQQMDLRVLPYVDAWIAWSRLADQIVGGRNSTKQNIAQFQMAGRKLAAEEEKLKKDASFNEELMR